MYASSVLYLIVRIVSLVAAVVGLVLRGIADLVGPQGCAACDAALERRSVFCSRCASMVERATTPAPKRAPFVFGGPLRDALHRLKYGSRPDLARPLGELLRAHVASEPGFERIDLVVAVPLHPKRLVDRGFNQAALLARSAARELGARFDTGLLVRTTATLAQARLSAEERRTNVDGAFTARRADRIRGRRVLLVDDVVTTGATMEACRRALLDAGAAEVVTLALAAA
ncbi:MAG: ComF family protein [Polyangiaceae bacterium]|nr:ComF family protein [Polyangiaceae bacterium]